MHEGINDYLVFYCCLDGQKNERKISLIFLVVMHEAMKEVSLIFLFCCCNKCTFIAMMHKKTPLPCFSLCKLSKFVKSSNFTKKNTIFKKDNNHLVPKKQMIGIG
jgi:hypothetical protein